MRMFSDTIKFYYDDLANRGWNSAADSLAAQWNAGTITSDDEIYAAYMLAYNNYVSPGSTPGNTGATPTAGTGTGTGTGTTAVKTTLAKYGPWLVLGGIALVALLSGRKGGK